MPTARAEFVQLDSGYRGYYALPDGSGPFPAVLVYQEAYGVNEYVQSEVRRLADHGYAAIAPDLFDGETIAYTNSDAAMARLRSMTDDENMAHVDAAIAFMRGQSQIEARRLGVVGFCMGGRLAFLTATARASMIGAAASFYGGGIAPETPRSLGTPSLFNRVPELQGALALFYGADDTSIPPQEHARLTEALSTSKKDYMLHVFPDAPHAFASTDRPSYRPVPAAIAWSETLALFERTLR